MLEIKENIIVKRGDSGPAVEDVQRRLNIVGFLKDSEINSFYDDATASAVKKFSISKNLDPTEDVTTTLWARLVDATFKLGDRNLYLRMPYFHGNDVLQLQNALGSLGFPVLNYNGIFEASTERALRRFQENMGLPSDGIVGSQTYTTLKNLKFTWENKKPLHEHDSIDNNVFWRASEVLEKHSICIFGTDEFTRDVAVRMSNLARATNPFSKVLSSNSLSVSPDKDTILLHIALKDEKIEPNGNSPRISYDETPEENCIQNDSEEDLNLKENLNFDNDLFNAEMFTNRLTTALSICICDSQKRLAVELPGKVWAEAGEDRSAQHFAITILDSLCSALQYLDELNNMS